MPTFHTDALVDGLLATLQEQQQRCTALAALPLEQLDRAPGPGQWSVLQVLGHLNILGGHYVHRLQVVYAQPGAVRYRPEFRSGFWGDRLTRAMQPRSNGSIPMPMRTLGRFEPSTTADAGMKELHDHSVLLATTLRLLHDARSQGLDGKRIVSTLGPLFQFKPGDAFRFTIAHQSRHFLQIERILAALEGPSA